jgi:hypothetical protein
MLLLIKGPFDVFDVIVLHLSLEGRSINNYKEISTFLPVSDEVPRKDGAVLFVQLSDTRRKKVLQT